MICERCQENEASVHLTRIINGKKEEIHLCEQCARESSSFNSNDSNLSFQSLLSGILNNSFSSENDSSLFNENKNNQIVCSNCNLSYHEFTQTGLFGCAECFNEFNNNLDNLFKRIHGSLRHKGKRPASYKRKMNAKTEIKELKSKMQEAVEKENFERAAELRDKIHAVKENMEEDKNAKEDNQ